MIKQLKAFWCEPGALPDFDTLGTLAYSYKARECVRMERQTIGFRQFPTLGEQQVIEFSGSRFLAAEVQRFKRSVPSQMLKRELNKRIDKLISEGGTVTKAEKAAIKSDIETELLPKMPQSDTIIPVIIDSKRALVWLGVSSDSACDDVLGLMRDGGINLDQVPVFHGIDLGRWITDWMLGRQDLPENMELGEKAKIASSSMPKVGVTVNNEDLTDAEIQAVASSRSVMEVGFTSEAIDYAIAHDGTIKGIKIATEGESFEDLIHQASYTVLEIANALDAIIERVDARNPFVSEQ